MDVRDDDSDTDSDDDSDDDGVGTGDGIGTVDDGAGAEDFGHTGAELPGVPATPRARAKSAALWGVVGALAFLVVAQGYLLLGGSVPIRYPRLFPLAAVIGAVTAVCTYLVEHRLRAKRRV